MNTKQKLLIGALGAAVAVVLAVLALLPRTENAASVKPEPTSTAVATIEPTTPTETPTPPVGGATIGGPGPSEDEGWTGTTADLSGHYKLADAAVLAYATVSDGETVKERAARLAKFFPAGSRYLTEPPRIANPWGYADIRADVTPTSRAVAGRTSETETAIEIMVTFSYEAHYVSDNQPMEVIDRGIWTVTMSKKYDGKLLSITEPDF